MTEAAVSAALFSTGVPPDNKLIPNNNLTVRIIHITLYLNSNVSFTRVFFALVLRIRSRTLNMHSCTITITIVVFFLHSPFIIHNSPLPYALHSHKALLAAMLLCSSNQSSPFRFFISDVTNRTVFHPEYLTHPF